MSRDEDRNRIVKNRRLFFYVHHSAYSLPPPNAKVMFSSLSVCMFVCLLLPKIFNFGKYVHSTVCCLPKFFDFGKYNQLTVCLLVFCFVELNS